MRRWCDLFGGPSELVNSLQDDHVDRGREILSGGTRGREATVRCFASACGTRAADVQKRSARRAKNPSWGLVFSSASRVQLARAALLRVPKSSASVR